MPSCCLFLSTMIAVFTYSTLVDDGFEMHILMKEKAETIHE